jgi:hypothetical protein
MSGRIPEVPGLVEVSSDPGERPACRSPGPGTRLGVKKKIEKLEERRFMRKIRCEKGSSRNTTLYSEVREGARRERASPGSLPRSCTGPGPHLL